ncbi:MAG: hypothetical protein LBC19_16765 [Tannerella sp.]|nr:hypothetical protein [Tannerella sp.]
MNQLVYISPFMLMSWESDRIPVREDILSAKRQRLAELEALGETLININGRPYSKDEIIKSFENILADTCMHYHLAVWTDKSLLQFLETGTYAQYRHFIKQEIYDEADFQVWLAPYFAAAFAMALEQAVEKETVQNIVLLLRECIRMDKDFETEAWEPVRKQMLKASSYLELYLESFDYNGQAKSIKHLGCVSFLQLLALKPEYLFYDETSEYTRLLHNIACDMPDTRNAVIFHNLLNLDLYPGLKEKCEKNYAAVKSFALFPITVEGLPGTWIYKNIVDTNYINDIKPSSSSSNIIQGCMEFIFYIVFIILVIALIVWLSSEGIIGSNSNRNIPKYNIPKYKITVPPPYNIPKIIIPDNIVLSSAAKKRGDSLRQIVDSVRQLLEVHGMQQIPPASSSILKNDSVAIDSLRQTKKERMTRIMLASDSILKIDGVAIDSLRQTAETEMQQSPSSPDSILKTGSAATDSLLRYKNDTVKIIDTIQR